MQRLSPLLPRAAPMCRSLSLSFAILAALILAGCSSGSSGPIISREGQVAKEPAAPVAAGNAGAKAGVADAAPVDRKIIYTADLDVVVKDLDAAIAEMEKLLVGAKGYIGKSEVNNNSGARRTAAYVLKVPAEGFTSLISAITRLGVAERNASNAQDVTEEFVDLQARLANLKKEEEAINKLLEKATQLADITLIRKERQPIRESIDRLEGRMVYLSKMSAISTVNLTLREIKDYKPPTTPSFGEKIADVFDGSWNSFTQFGKGVVLVVVALTPWLPLLVPAMFVVYYLLRRMPRPYLKGLRPAPPGPRNPDSSV